MPPSPPCSSGGGTDAKRGATAARPDQDNRQLAVSIRDVLDRPVGPQSASGASRSGAVFLILRIPPAVGRHLRRCWSGSGGRAVEHLARLCPRGRCLLAGRRGAVRLAHPEDEDCGEPNQDRGGEEDHRAGGQRVERAVEQEAEPVDHRTPPAVWASTPGGWA